MFGREPMFLVDIRWSLPASHGEHHTDDVESEYATQLREELQLAYESTRRAQALAATITKGLLDEWKRNVRYDANQLVDYWIKHKDPKVLRKLDHSWSTPHIVKRASAESPSHYYIKPSEAPSALAMSMRFRLFLTIIKTTMHTRM